MKYIEDADVVIWSLGVSNFPIYIIRPGEQINIPNTNSVIPPISGKVYFTDDYHSFKFINIIK